MRQRQRVRHRPTARVPPRRRPRRNRLLLRHSLRRFRPRRLPGVQNVRILALALVPRPPFNDELRRFYPHAKMRQFHTERKERCHRSPSHSLVIYSLSRVLLFAFVKYLVCLVQRLDPRGLFSRFSTLIILQIIHSRCVARFCSPDERLRALLALLVTTTTLSFPPLTFRILFFLRV